MAIHLDHLMVPARNKTAAAKMPTVSYARRAR